MSMLGEAISLGNSMGCSNGNGAFWSLLSMIFDALGSLNIPFITATRASLVQALPDIRSYHWFFAYRQETLSSGHVWGSSGIACMTKDSLWGNVSMVATDEFVRFIEIQISSLAPTLQFVTSPTAFSFHHSKWFNGGFVPTFVCWHHSILNGQWSHPLGWFQCLEQSLLDSPPFSIQICALYSINWPRLISLSTNFRWCFGAHYKV